VTIYLRCFRCNEALANWDESAQEEFYVGEIGHICSDGSLAITKLNKWYDKQGKEIDRIEQGKAVSRRRR